MYNEPEDIDHLKIPVFRLVPEKHHREISAVRAAEKRHPEKNFFWRSPSLFLRFGFVCAVGYKSNKAQYRQIGDITI